MKENNAPNVFQLTISYVLDWSQDVWIFLCVWGLKRERAQNEGKHAYCTVKPLFRHL